MKIRIYLAFLIARLQMLMFNKKLYRQCKLLPVANKFKELYASLLLTTALSRFR